MLVKWVPDMLYQPPGFELPGCYGEGPIDFILCYYIEQESQKVVSYYPLY